MITTTQKKYEEQVKQPAYQPQAAQRPTQGYTGLTGVSEETAQQLGQKQQGYQPNTTTQAVQQQLQQLQAQKPQGYTSKYSDQLEGILQQLKGQKFNYSLNGDAFFNSLKDTRMEAAKQASLNAMGQAAALTGGYGNSYAQAAANQAAQQELLHLNDDAMNAYNLALQRFQMEQQGLGDQFNRLAQMENTDYGRHRDTVSDFNTERGYLTDLYNTEEDRGYNRYMNDLDYMTKLAQIENADYRSEQERQEAIRQFEMQYQADQDRFNWQKDVDQRDYDRGVLESDRAYDMQQKQFEESVRQFDESVRQFNESLNWDKMSSDQKYAADYAMAILQMGQMPSEELLQAAGLSAEDAQKLMAQLTTTGGGGPGSTKPTYYVDLVGNYYVDDGKGNYVPVDKNNVDPNGMEDLSKRELITRQNIVGGTWGDKSNAQQAQKTTDKAAAEAAAAAKAETKTTEAGRRTQAAQTAQGNTQTQRQMDQYNTMLYNMLTGNAKKKKN